MIANERYFKILELLNQKQSITINEMTKLLNTSESTIRRDLTVLHNQKKLIKVHGGAISNQNLYISGEQSLTDKKLICQNEKKDIAKKATEFISPNDFVYIDAGTTTYQMVHFIKEKSATYMTNSINIATYLTENDFNVFIVGGQIKSTTQAIIGCFAKDYIQNFNFNVGFFGTNGISIQNGYTTPDIEEASIKKIAMSKCGKRFVLSDNSKFDLVSSVTFGDLKNATIITNISKNSTILNLMKQHTKILEV